MDRTEVVDRGTAVGPNILRVGDSYICSGIEPTFVPLGGDHVRQVFIELPVRFVGRPTVTALVHPRENPAAGGVAFVVYNVTVTPLGTTGTQIKISATNNAVGVGAGGLFECDYVVVGQAAT
ncbi:hypothetical protein [Amycolatopsis suaedae]|uniref:Uncharacterized protein n=1 Tax=Amycolatopsis suaedae TaxID=2510978 RepID=A0A4Q7JFS9_9PSEU|nr:hypothetical protein [Amycolatopsis suaedae]RZQ65773.1 hypothetical protein EWH70_01420 [Amycolatopsis suaedae]